MVWPILVSSAKIAQIVSGERTVGRSLIYRRNSRGPKIEPWGMPEVTGRHSDVRPSSVTLCILLVK